MAVYDKNGRMIKSSRKSIKSGIPFKNRGFNLTGHEIQDMEWRINSGETVDYNGWTFVKDDDFGTIVATSPEGKTYDGFKSLSGFMDLYEYGSIESSRKSIKSSRASLELAFDRAGYCCKKLFKSEEGGRYNKWYCYGAEFGQDHAWFKVEHTDYSVRLSFEFMDTGFVYVDGYFTNGSSYDKKTITSWKFDSESEDATADRVKQVLDRFFDEGINVLRGEEDIMSSTKRNENSLRAVFGK